MPTPKAKFEISADDKTAAAFKSALNNGKKFGGEFSSVLKASFAGIAVGSLTGAISKAIEYGDELGKLKAKSNLSTAAAAELSYAFQQNDLDINMLSTSMRKMQMEISKGSDIFEKLGLNLDELKEQAPDKQFEILAQRISELRDPADRTRAAVEIFGKSGADLLPLFERGARGIREARQEAVRFGHSMSEEAVKALQEGDKAIKQLEATWGSFMRELAVGAVKFGEWAGAIDVQVSPLQKELDNVNDGLAKTNELIDELTLRKSRAGAVRLSDEAVAGERVGASRAGGGLDISQLRATAASLAKKKTELEATMKEAAAQSAKNVTGGADTLLGSAQATIERTRDINPQTRQEFEEGSQWLEDYAKGLESANELTKTELAKSIDEWNRFDAALQTLVQSGTISVEEAAKRKAEYVNTVLPEVQLSVEKVKTAVDEVEPYLDQLHDSLYSSFHDLFMDLGNGADDFADSLLNTFKSLLADVATKQLFEALGSLGSSSSGSGWGDLLAGLFTANAKGNAYGRGGLITAFANGGVVSGATPFAHAGGLGVMGEDGDEAIMPLSRGSDGKLGVKAQGGGESTTIAPTYHINITGEGVTRAQVATALKQTHNATVATIQDMKRRGKF